MRGRVPIGIGEFGVPIMKQISAKNEFEFMIRAGQMMVASGILDDYILHSESRDRKAPKKITFKSVAERWFKVYKEDNVALKPSTREDYRRLLDKVVYPVLGEKPIDEITTTHIQEMLNGYRDMAITTQTRLIVTLRQIFNMAVEEELIKTNPAKGKLTKTGIEKKDGRALSKEEWLGVQSILPDMKEADRLFVALMMYEGLRRGEALGMTWDNVDFENNCLHIVQQAAFNGNDNYATIQTPKTKTSIRDVPMVKALRRILENTPRRGMYVVGNGDTPYTKSMMVKALKRIKEATGIEDLHPHTFRYSHATMLHEVGVDDKTIQCWEGHASQATTTNFYIKSSQDMTDRANAILSEFAFSGA